MESVTSALKSLAHFHAVSMSFVKTNVRGISERNYKICSQIWIITFFSSQPETVAGYDFLCEAFQDWRYLQDAIDKETGLFLEDNRENSTIVSNKDLFKDFGRKGP